MSFPFPLTFSSSVTVICTSYTLHLQKCRPQSFMHMQIAFSRHTVADSFTHTHTHTIVVLLSTHISSQFAPVQSAAEIEARSTWLDQCKSKARVFNSPSFLLFLSSSCDPEIRTKMVQLPSVGSQFQLVANIGYGTCQGFQMKKLTVK